MNSNKYEQFIGKRIRDTRIKQGISQEMLYQKTGIKNTTISAFENGKRFPGLQNLALIAKALNVTIDELYFGDESIAFIEKAPDRGAKIVNCLYELITEDVISTACKTNELGVHQLTVKQYSGPIQRLMNNLNDFFNRYNTYSNPESFCDQIKESVATEINEQLGHYINVTNKTNKTLE
ncbi:MAG: helix-turn-helix transcriptional regulator [Erysipelotrichaceae bacterium]|nr:helix-turn-helix transcriptional regulator [Erysipelotrichaceae bacterium]